MPKKASWREKRREYGAARIYYQKLLEQFPESPQADAARKRLAATDKLPDVPEQRLSWLADLFPDRRDSPPLKTVESEEGKKKSSGRTMLR